MRGRSKLTVARLICGSLCCILLNILLLELIGGELWVGLVLLVGKSLVARRGRLLGPTERGWHKVGCGFVCQDIGLVVLAHHSILCCRIGGLRGLSFDT